MSEKGINFTFLLTSPRFESCMSYYNLSCLGYIYVNFHMFCEHLLILRRYYVYNYCVCVWLFVCINYTRKRILIIQYLVPPLFIYSMNSDNQYKHPHQYQLYLFQLKQFDKNSFMLIIDKRPLQGSKKVTSLL